MKLALNNINDASSFDSLTLRYIVVVRFSKRMRLFAAKRFLIRL